MADFVVVFNNGGVGSFIQKVDDHLEDIHTLGITEHLSQAYIFSVYAQADLFRNMLIEEDVFSSSVLSVRELRYQLI